MAKKQPQTRSPTQRRGKTPRRWVIPVSRQISPTIDNSMWFENGISIPAQFDAAVGDGFKVILRSITLVVRTESPGQHWVQPLLIETTAVMTDAVDLAVNPFSIPLDSAIAGSYGCHYLGRPRWSRDVPGNNRAGGEDLTEVASEGLFFTTEIPKWALKLIQAQIEEANPAEEISISFLGWSQVQIADLNLFYWLLIDYDYDLNELGVGR